MSPMSDPRMAGQPAQPSQEEMRAYLEQLREADAAGLVAEAFNLLATGAQVKLGRQDARVLIDALAAMVEASAPTMPQQITEQMKQGVAQLQLAQVEAEREMAAEQQQSGSGDAASEAGGDTPQPDAGASPGPATGPGGQRMTDRLWVPGRDPRPPAR
jgi:hypothetical protein